MKKTALTAVMVALVALLAGCDRGGGDPSDDIDTLSLIKRANAALLNVRDAETAKAAKPTFQELTTQLRSNAKKGGKTGPPANENDRTSAAAKELIDNALRVKSDPAINSVLGADLDAFVGVMNGAG